jgi:hypothetical protein
MRVFISLCLAACAGKDVEPVLQALPFTVAPVDLVTLRAGDLDFTQEISEDKVLLEFAGLLIDGGTGPEGVILPHLTVRLAADVQIRAAADGVVEAAEVNTDSDVPGDFELRIAAVAGSRWIVSYDHVSEPTVADGDAVSAGDVLGYGIWEKKFEVDVMDKSTDERWCQSRFYDPAVKADLEGRLTTLFAEWEAYKGDPDIYDEAAMFAPGCATERFSFD